MIQSDPQLIFAQQLCACVHPILHGVALHELERCRVRIRKYVVHIFILSEGMFADYELDYSVFVFMEGVQIACAAWSYPRTKMWCSLTVHVTQRA